MKRKITEDRIILNKIMEHDQPNVGSVFLFNKEYHLHKFSIYLAGQTFRIFTYDGNEFFLIELTSDNGIIFCNTLYQISIDKLENYKN